MATYLEQQYKMGAYATIKDPQELARRLDMDLHKAHHDGHFHFMYAPLLARQLSDTAHARERRDDSLQLINMRKSNFFFTNAEILPGNIGYVKFNAFVGYLKEARPTFTGAFRFVANTDALIIDMRNNGGGSPAMVCQVASYFLPAGTHWNDIVDRVRTTEFWTDPKDADSLMLSMPVYILTARRTFSGAEDFTYGMQSLKRATIVGDTTGGGAHPTGPVVVGLGFVANVPHARSLNPYTHTDWEGTGVIPNIAVNADDALEAAEKAIANAQIQHAANDNERKIAQWLLDDVTARHSQQVMDSSTLAAYTGQYQGGLVFYVNGSALYCRNGERGDLVFKLYPISPDAFVLDENVHVEFVKEGGRVSGMHMRWSNGGTSYKAKEK